MSVEKIWAKAAKLVSKGRIDEAVKFCTDSHYPRFAAQCLENAGRLQEAAELYQEAKAWPEYVRCLLACGLENQALTFGDGEPVDPRDYYATRVATSEYRKHIERLDQAGKRVEALQYMVKACHGIREDDWYALMSRFQGKASGQEQLRLWAQVLMEDRRVRYRYTDDWRYREPEWREALAFFVAGDEKEAYRIFKENILLSPADSRSKPGCYSLKNLPEETRGAEALLPFMHWLVRQYVAEDESPSPHVLETIAFEFPVDAKRSRLWPTLPPDIQRRVVRLLCQSWSYWPSATAVDQDGKPVGGVALLEVKALDAIDSLIRLYQDTGRADPEMEDAISALAKDRKLGHLWGEHLKSSARLKEAMAFILHTDVMAYYGTSEVLGPNNQPLTATEAWQARQEQQVWDYVSVCLASGQHDAEAEKAVLDHVERIERYDLVLSLLEQFGRLDEAQRLLDEVPPQMIWPTSPNPVLAVKAYRDRLAFMAARRRKSASTGMLNKGELERMLALGEITSAEYERMVAQLEEERHSGGGDHD